MESARSLLVDESDATTLLDKNRQCHNGGGVFGNCRRDMPASRDVIKASLVSGVVMEPHRSGDDICDWGDARRAHLSNTHQVRTETARNYDHVFSDDKKFVAPSSTTLCQEKN